jgi:hypothetical protein
MTPRGSGGASFFSLSELGDFYAHCSAQVDWAEQAGGNERRVFGEVVPGGERKSAFRGAGLLFHKGLS